MVMTFSRSAWIAAFIITLVAIGLLLKGRRRLLVYSFTGLLVGAGLILVYVAAPQLIARGISNKHHFERTKDGIIMMLKNPMGLGLGKAGPASNRLSDACLYFEKDADISWARDRSDLCLFVDEVQVQPLPSDRVCTCPMLPENWYVQIGIELGWLGFVGFVGLVFYIIVTLLHCYIAKQERLSVLLMFVGVSIAALFLHAWEDSAVAYCVWGMVGCCLSRERGKRIVERG